MSGFEVLTSMLMQGTIFYNLTPWRQSQARHQQDASHNQGHAVVCYFLVSCSACYLTPKMEALLSSETYNYRIARRWIPGNSILQNILTF
jgi:hypothetical protein